MPNRRTSPVPCLILGLLLTGLSSSELLSHDGSDKKNLAVCADAPKLVIAEPDLEWGSVRQGDLVVKYYTIKNAGNAPLIISSVKASCGCTAVHYDEEVPPGGSGILRLEMKADRVSGSLTRSAKIHTNDSKKPVARVTMRGAVRAVAEFEPPHLALVGFQGSIQSGEIHVRPGPDLSIELLEVASKHGRFQTGVVQSVEGGESVIVVTEAKSQESKMFVADSVFVRLRTSEGKVVELKVPVTLRRRQAIEVNPAQGLVFRRSDTRLLDEGKTVSQELRVRAARAGEHFNIDKARLEGVPEELCNLKIEPIREGSEYRILVVLKAAPETRFLGGKIVIHTDHPTCSVLECRVVMAFGR